MTENDEFFIIVSEQIDDTQRNLMQAAVKSNAKQWWHEMLDVWVVQGGTATEWRDLLKVFVTIGGSSVMVFRLPQPPQGNWSAYGKKTMWAWFTEHYRAAGGRPPTAGSGSRLD